MKDTYETDHVLFIVMELLHGGDLFDRIVEKGRYSEASARLVLKNILSAVAYLHSKDIIHRYIFDHLMISLNEISYRQSLTLIIV